MPSRARQAATDTVGAADFSDTVLEFNDVRTLLGLVASHLGISIVPRSVSVCRLPVKLIPLSGPAFRWQLRVATQAGEHPRVLVEMLRSASLTTCTRR
jgi:DNA-binding transcriptional LysR family regulator